MSVREDPRNPGFYLVDVEVELPDGRRVRKRKHGFRTRNRAKRAEERIKRELYESRYKASAERRRAEQEQRRIPTLAAFAPVYLSHCETEEEQKPSTIAWKRTLLKNRIIRDLGHIRVDRIGNLEIEECKRKWQQEGIARRTVNKHLNVTSNLLKIAHKLRLRPDRIVFDRLKINESLEQRGRRADVNFDYLTFEETERLVSGAHPDWADMILIAGKTGLRLGELRGLQWEAVNFDRKLLHVFRCLVEVDGIDVETTTKSKKSRDVPLPKSALESLRQLRHLRGPWVFCNDDGTPRRRYQCRHGLKRQSRKVLGEDLGWHVLRHTYASHLAMKNVPILKIKELLGHQDVNVTQRYAKLSPASMHADVALLDC